MAEMTLKEAALYYAKLGLAVFPLKPRSKKPATKNGFKAATMNLEQIAEWWDQHPDSNVGIATGKVSGGLVVIDLDIDEDRGKNGYEVLKEWQREHGVLPETAMVITGRGGYHYYYRDAAHWGNRAGLYEGVDIRADGGYVVAPPSVHENGRRYEWEQDPSTYGITAANQTVFDFLMPVPNELGKESFQMPDTIPEGQRTDTLVKLVCSQQAKGLSDEAIRAAVRAENEARCVPPLTDEELEKTVFPAIRRYQKGNAPYCKAVPDKGGFRPMKEKKIITYSSADTLMAADLPPVNYFIDGLLTQGLGGLSAKSKLGKSWLALQMAVALACGDKFLGFSTRKTGALYIDLENTPSLTQDRLRMVLDGRNPPGDLYFAHDFNLMGQGFEEDLVDFLTAHEDVKVVIIDVFQKVKRGKKMNQTDYEADYEILTKLKAIADKFGVCIFPIYHDRKFMDPNDPFANLLGSTAVIGVSDFMWVLFKEKREDKEATLAVTGRTIREASYKLSRKAVSWEMLGDAAAIEERRKRQEYEDNPIVNTIRKLVDQEHGKWRGRMKEIIESSQYFKGCRIYGTPQKISADLKKLIPDLERFDGIHHTGISNGTAGHFHVFEREHSFGFEDAIGEENPFEKGLA